MGGWTERFSCLNISPSLHAVCAWALLEEIWSLIAQCYVSSLLLWHNPWQEKHEVGMTSSVSHLWVEHITVGKTQQQGLEMGGHAASAVRRQSWTLVFNLFFFFLFTLSGTPVHGMVPPTFRSSHLNEPNLETPLKTCPGVSWMILDPRTRQSISTMKSILHGH